MSAQAPLVYKLSLEPVPSLSKKNFEFGFDFVGIFEFLKSSAVCITPWSQVTKISQKAPGCASHRGVKLRGVKIEIFVSLLLLLKGHRRVMKKSI